jgi:transcriptional regulator of acetoin/glycerol metabolism
MQAFVASTWLGNVRELENFVERSVILSPGSTFSAPISELRDEVPVSDGNSLLEDVERDHMLRIFRETGGVISATAARLGIPRTTRNARMKKLGVSRADL